MRNHWHIRPVDAHLLLLFLPRLQSAHDFAMSPPPNGSTQSSSKLILRTRSKSAEISSPPHHPPSSPPAWKPMQTINLSPTAWALYEHDWSGQSNGVYIQWSKDARYWHDDGTSNSLVMSNWKRRKAITEHICVDVISRFGLNYARILAGPHHTRTVRDDNGRIKVPDQHHITVTSCKHLVTNGGWDPSWRSHPTWHIYLRHEGFENLVVVGVSCVVRLGDDPTAKPVIDSRYTWGKYTRL
ncbi:hypothetical protein FB567DRAFT_214731 [Paraphoma chrysanthemicola]|uniref:Uncharacterized protein n=1 Tax=Paraphoma chrysanthemicola TaxID=798071 RepID=A0A8K0QTP3_9PLEO|nr:hypothetical protein FB567DRAFT_214731 [Paraphoma chrysanthemicola]